MALLSFQWVGVGMAIQLDGFLKAKFKAYVGNKAEMIRMLEESSSAYICQNKVTATQTNKESFLPRYAVGDIFDVKEKVEVCYAQNTDQTPPMNQMLSHVLFCGQGLYLYPQSANRLEIHVITHRMHELRR